jgi:hypothetical protein
MLPAKALTKGFPALFSSESKKVVGALLDFVTALPERNISSALHAKRFPTK